MMGLRTGVSLEFATARGRYVAEYQARNGQRRGVLGARAQWPGVVGAILVGKKYGLPCLRLAAEVVDGRHNIGPHDAGGRRNRDVDGLADGRGAIYLDEDAIHAGFANDHARIAGGLGRIVFAGGEGAEPQARGEE